MSIALSVSTRVTAAAALAGLALGVLGPLPQVLAADTAQITSTTQQTLPTVDFIAEKPLIAHCGLEGCPISATQLMSSTSTGSAVDRRDSVSDSLWGNLILMMAYQRDTELQALAKKLGRVDVFTLTSVAAISALGLAQGLTTLHTLDDEPHKKYPVALGLVGTSMSLVSLGGRVYLGHHYRDKIAARQRLIKGQVEIILDQIETGHPFDEPLQNQLKQLIGNRATQEFMGIWESKQPHTAMNIQK